MNGPLLGILRDVPAWEGVTLFVLLALALGYTGASLAAWSLVIALALYGWNAPSIVWIAFGLLVAFFSIPPLRRQFSRLVMRWMEEARFLPILSQSDQAAIEAGTVWFEGEFFSGRPDLKRIVRSDYPGLSTDERAFLDGPVQTLCDLTDDWEVFCQRGLPAVVWEQLAADRLFGLVIPAEYGGHGFSASGTSAVLGKIASASPVLGITVSVPNALGPSELLIRHGTPDQKEYWLPRLASHQEIPAFALTEPGAGSDVDAIVSRGEVFRDDEGDLMLRLHWSKRYVTLAPVATVLGLVFKLRDPKNLIGKGPEPGMTVALVRTNEPGVRTGDRHDPMGVPFLNGPTTGEGVVVKLDDAVIGGVDGVGRGWPMIMESRAAGRAIFLPATAVSGVKHAARVASAHAVVRRQSGVPIGKFEGVEEPLARLGGFSYLVDAARRFACGGVDAGEKPAVVSAMLKYSSTELHRRAVNDAMDVQGGSAIARGPDNALAHPYMYVPIPITVDGSNIRTRTHTIFGHGALRCHPYILSEIRAAAEHDVRSFDEALWGHFGHVVRNEVRAFILSLTRGAVGQSPVRGEAAGYWRRLGWASATFAFWSDLALAVHGSDLKRPEKLMGRFADVLTWTVIASAVLRRFEAEGRRREDLPFLHWSMRYALSQVQAGFDGVFENMEIRGFGWIIRGPVAAWSRFNRIARPPSDRLSGQVARLIQVPGSQRERILGGVHTRSRPLVRLESAMDLCQAVEPLWGAVAEAVRKGLIRRGPPQRMIESAVSAGIITTRDSERMLRAEAARDAVIQVDSFSEPSYLKTAHPRPREDGGTRDQVHRASEKGRRSRGSD